MVLLSYILLWSFFSNSASQEGYACTTGCANASACVLTTCDAHIVCDVAQCVCAVERDSQGQLFAVCPDSFGLVPISPSCSSEPRWYCAYWSPGLWMLLSVIAFLCCACALRDLLARQTIKGPEPPPQYYLVETPPPPAWTPREYGSNENREEEVNIGLEHSQA